MTAADPGRALRRALMAWGLGHLVIGQRRLGYGLLAAELLCVLTIAWLTIGLADTNLYLVPFLAGMAFIAGWAWQAVHAYRSAHRLQAARPPTPTRSPAAAIGWLSLPLLLWGTGFWIIGAHAATPASVLDRFVTDWNDGELAATWPAAVRSEAAVAAAGLGPGPERFRDIRIRIVRHDERGATAVADAVHFERRASSFLGIFPGSELVPVADEQILSFDLEARPVELPGGGDIGAVRWELVTADATP
ncbi:MAG: hypothetical protein M3406_11965 [Chloroflexota bacterium]|nr:hypothetical protein [Chloroflexota bacterium]